MLAGLLAIAGLVFGAATYFKDRRAQSRQAEIAALPDARHAPLGERSVLNGAIATDVPVLAHDFVVYVTYQHSKNLTRAIDGLQQPLRIETADGVVEIVNNDYTLDRWLARWGHETREVSPPGWTSGAITAQGLLPRQSIMAVGWMNADGHFEAETVGAGPRATYIETLSAQSAWWLARTWLMIVPFMLAYAVWTSRAILRAP
jgi:hypothetical protein